MSLNQLSVGEESEKSNGVDLKGGGQTNSAYNGSLGGDFDEIDLQEKSHSAITVPPIANGISHNVRGAEEDEMTTNIAANVTDMMLDDIYEETQSLQEDDHFIEEHSHHVDSNAVTEATEQEVQTAMGKPVIAIHHVQPLELDLSPRSGTIDTSTGSAPVDSEREADEESIPAKPPRPSLRQLSEPNADKKSQSSNISVETIISGHLHSTGDEVAESPNMEEVVDSEPIDERQSTDNAVSETSEKRQSLTATQIEDRMRPEHLPPPVPRKRSPLRKVEAITATSIQVNSSPPQHRGGSRMYAEASSDSSESSSSDSEEDASKSKSESRPTYVGLLEEDASESTIL